MGTRTISNQFKNCTPKELARLVQAECESAGYEDGHSYSGNWGDKIGHGLNITDKSFASIRDAMDWLEDGQLDSYGPLVAVKVMRKNKSINTSSIDKQINDAKTKRNDFLHQAGDDYVYSWSDGVKSLVDEAVARVKTQKSKLKTCGACGSKVAVAHVSHGNCPVCNDHNFVLTATDRKRIDLYRAKADEFDKKVKSLKAKRTAKVQQTAEAKIGKTNWIWLVAGDCRD